MTSVAISDVPARSKGSTARFPTLLPAVTIAGMPERPEDQGHITLYSIVRIDAGTRHFCASHLSLEFATEMLKKLTKIFPDRDYVMEFCETAPFSKSARAIAKKLEGDANKRL